MMKQSRDFARVFSENWNRKLKSVRLLGAVVSLCMLVCAVLCMHSAVPMHQALKTAAALVIIALGMYQLVDYYYMPVLLYHWWSCCSMCRGFLCEGLSQYEKDGKEPGFSASA